MSKANCFEWEKLTLKDKARLEVAHIKTQISKATEKVYPTVNPLYDDEFMDFDDEDYVI